MSGPPPHVGRGRARGRGGPKGDAPKVEAVRGRGPPLQIPPAQQQAPRPMARPGPSSSAGGPVGNITQKLATTTLGGNGDGNGNGNGGGNGGSVGRGGVRGRRILDTGDVVLRTRPENMVSKQGSSGDPVPLNCNYFKLERRPDWVLYQFRVDFSEEEDRTEVRRAWVNEHKAKLGKSFVFDGTMIFASTMIAPIDKPLTLITKRREDDKPVKIEIKFTAQIEDGHNVYIQFYNLLLRRCMGKLNLQLVGRNLFDAKAAISIPDYNISLWPGYLTSIRQHERELLMCVEFTHKVMRTDTAYNIIEQCSRERDFKTAFLQAIIGSTVLTPYNNKTYRIDDVDFNSSPNSKFSTKEGDISFAAYYSKRYNIRIRDLNQPLLISKAKGRDIRAGKAEVLLLIPELCNMTGLTDSMRSDFRMMKALAAEMFIRPGDRIKKLRAFNDRLQRTAEIKSELEGWDFKLGQQLVPVTGRQLKPELIVFGNNIKMSAGPDANWTRTSIDKPMFVNADFRSWVVVFPNTLQRDITNFTQLINRVSGPMGFRIPEPVYYNVDQDKANILCEAVDRIMSRTPPDLILFGVMNNNADRYNAIKKKCYIDRAVSSQVVCKRNLAGKNAMTVATKVAIQLNCKLGGAPWTIEMPTADTMIVGFDVCHTKQKTKSFGALVATMNKAMTSWFSTVSHHSSGEELSKTFAFEMSKAVRAWYNINKALPSRIIIYRDGVGDGQLGHVYSHEVENVKRTLNEIYKDQPWKLVYIIVTKRINTRVFKTNEQNAQPGTIVDDVITLPEKYDFYLVSQHPMQGTASPCSYNVIFDNAGWKPDILQRLTYKLTHLYYNYSGSVCVPAPCQYAHKLAFLVGTNLQQLPNNSLSDRLYFI